MKEKKRYLLRIITPAYPAFNIYSNVATKTTALGPVIIGTMAYKLQNWDVETIDENNIHSSLCPKDSNKRPDHVQLQNDQPADVVAFYGGLSSTAPRIFELAALYKKMGAITLAGGKHIENLPEEALNNDIDIVAFSDGEYIIQDILTALENDTGLKAVDGIAYMKEDMIRRTDPRPVVNDLEALPYPNFNLLRFANLKLYPINWSRGCNMNCEFCAVKSRSRCSSPEYMINQITHLVEHYDARQFFEVSDHFASKKDEAIRFCNMLADYQEKIGKKLKLNIQTRITDARHPDLLKAMKRVGINMIAVGYESPIDEDLKTMNKGYLSKDMVEWTKAFRKEGFFVHGMFIFGYPRKNTDVPSAKMDLSEKVKRYRKFIQDAKIDTLQVMLPIPLPGTELSERLRKEGRIYPLSEIGWEYYDGQFPIFEPDDGISPEEMQAAVSRIMRRFYSLNSLRQVVTRILLHFPLIMLPAATTLVTLKVKYLKNAFLHWKRRYFRTPLVKMGGYFVTVKWLKDFKENKYIERLKKARKIVWERMKKNTIQTKKPREYPSLGAPVS